MRPLLILLAGGLAASAAWAQDPMGDPDAGHAIATETCAVCHAVEPGERVSPEEDAPPFSAVARDPLMSELGLRVFLRTPHPRMPNFILPPSEIDDIVAYIRGLRRE